MATVSIYTARTTLPRPPARVEASAGIVIARGGTPIAKLVAVHPPSGRRQFGALRGLISVDAAFFEPLPAAELQAWNTVPQ